MSNVFTADPDAMRIIGNGILDKAGEFKREVATVYNTITEMTTNNYLSPDAAAIAKKIESYKATLEDMGKVIEDYGNFCLQSSDAVVRNQENNASGV